MAHFVVYQQQFPIPVPNTSPQDWRPNLVPIASIEADDGAEAIRLAKKLPAFRAASRRSLAAYPVVEAIANDGPWWI
jgi:hypothetical protein